MTALNCSIPEPYGPKLACFGHNVVITDWDQGEEREGNCHILRGTCTAIDQLCYELGGTNMVRD